MKRYHFCGEEDNATESEDGGYVKYEDAIAAIKAAVEAEREACAQLAETSHPDDWAFIGALLRNRCQK